MMIDEIICDYLIAAGETVRLWDCSTSDSSTTIYPTGGYEDIETINEVQQGWRRSTIQIRYIDKVPAQLIARIERIRNLLYNIDVAGVEKISQISDPISLGKDTQGRFAFTHNFIVSYNI